MTVSRIISSESWEEAWIWSLGSVTAVLNAGIPAIVLGEILPVTLPTKWLPAVFSLVLFVTTFVLAVDLFYILDQRAADRLPAVENPTPNFVVILIPAVYVISMVLTLLAVTTVYTPVSLMDSAVVWILLNISGLGSCLLLVYDRSE